MNIVIVIWEWGEREREKLNEQRQQILISFPTPISLSKVVNFNRVCRCLHRTIFSNTSYSFYNLHICPSFSLSRLDVSTSTSIYVCLHIFSRTFCNSFREASVNVMRKLLFKIAAATPTLDQEEIHSLCTSQKCGSWMVYFMRFNIENKHQFHSNDICVCVCLCMRQVTLCTGIKECSQINIFRL